MLEIAGRACIGTVTSWYYFANHNSSMDHLFLWQMTASLQHGFCFGVSHRNSLTAMSLTSHLGMFLWVLLEALWGACKHKQGQSIGLDPWGLLFTSPAEDVCSFLRKCNARGDNKTKECLEEKMLSKHFEWMVNLCCVWAHDSLQVHLWMFEWRQH